MHHILHSGNIESLLRWISLHTIQDNFYSFVDTITLKDAILEALFSNTPSLLYFCTTVRTAKAESDGAASEIFLFMQGFVIAATFVQYSFYQDHKIFPFKARFYHRQVPF